jgi:hypothetical protein
MAATVPAWSARMASSPASAASTAAASLPWVRDAADAVGRDVHRRQERAVALLVGRLRGRQGGGAQGAPVEAALEGDDAGPTGGAAGQLDGAVDRLGPAVAQEHLGVVEERRQLGDGLRGLDVRLVLEHHGRVQEALDLPVDGVEHARVPVAGVRDGDAGAEVEVAPAFDVPHPAALGAVGDHVEVRRQHRRHHVVVAGQPRFRAGDLDCGHHASRLSICARWRRPE